MVSFPFVRLRKSGSGVSRVERGYEGVDRNRAPRNELRAAHYLKVALVGLEIRQAK